jgi:UDP-N-acetylglucosamine 4,6-dehydratase
MAPDLSQKIVGIRPGEKIHEIMCPADDSHLTLEFDDHYVITPSIQFNDEIDFTKNSLGERGVHVEQGHEYNSGTNNEWLLHEEFLQMVDDVDSS